MNAAERLWRAVRRRDWPAAVAQLHPQAIIERPHAGRELTVDEFVVAHRADAGRTGVEVVRVVGDGHTIVVEAAVRGARGVERCAGLYDLHEGRIARGVEYWVPEPR